MNALRALPIIFLILAFWRIFHSYRHSFATTVTLGNGVPIETVSKMLGHTSIRTTQIYARITNQKLSQDMDALARKIDGMVVNI